MSHDEYDPLITRLGNDREAFEYIYGLINDVLGGEMHEEVYMGIDELSDLAVKIWEFARSHKK